MVKKGPQIQQTIGRLNHFESKTCPKQKSAHVIIHRTLSFPMRSQKIEPTLFQPATSDLINQFLQQAPLLVGAFAFAEHEESSLCLHLFQNALLIKDQLKNWYYLKLQFDVNFEIIYLQKKDVKSEIVGIGLYSEGESLDLYGQDSADFARALAKILNMKGFHEMFRPIKKLGTGNFATVYEAERVTDRQRFAVKAFSKQNTYCSKNGKQSLINELSLLRSLNIQPHPNVLRLESVYESQNSIYIVLQLLQGETLLHLQARTANPLSPKEIKVIMRGLLKGVAHLVANRVMHRDLKPENIMVRQGSMEPVIVDFGLATNVDLPEYLFYRCGTPGYVAPEITMLTQSTHLEPTCDMFSLGAVFHLLLVKEPLFAGCKYEQVVKNNRQFKFCLQTDAFQKLGEKTVDLIGKMLVMNPSLRIKPEVALLHPYFSDWQSQTRKDSPTVKVRGSLEMNANAQPRVEWQKKKKKFLFF